MHYVIDAWAAAKGAFGWYDLEQDRTAGAHGAASCQPNGTPETEHIFVEKCDHLRPKSMFQPGFTVKSETARSARAWRPEQAEHVLADPEQVQAQPNALFW